MSHYRTAVAFPRAAVGSLAMGHPISTESDCIDHRSPSPDQVAFPSGGDWGQGHSRPDLVLFLSDNPAIFIEDVHRHEDLDGTGETRVVGEVYDLIA